MIRRWTSSLLLPLLFFLHCAAALPAAAADDAPPVALAASMPATTGGASAASAASVASMPAFAAGSSVEAKPASAAGASSAAITSGTSAAPAAPAPDLAASGSHDNACGPSGSAARCSNPAAPVLRLVIDTVSLPAARVGSLYERQLSAGGGSPVYTFTLASGTLPPGLVLGAGGRLAGLPTSAGSFQFRVEVRDAAQPPAVAVQGYTVRVAAVKPKPPPAPASAPASTPLISAEDALATLDASSAGDALVYQLTAADIDALVPTAPAEAASAASDAPPPMALDIAPAHLAQLREVLLRMQDVEYPTRLQFERSVESHLCDYVVGLFLQSEHRQEATASTAPGPRCPLDQSPPAPAARPALLPTAARLPASSANSGLMPIPLATTAPATSPAAASATLSPPALAALILPESQRAIVTAQARKPYPFALDPKRPLRWTGGDCACVFPDLSGDVVAFYPFWTATAQPQTIDFSVIRRLQYFALPFGEDGSLPHELDWSGSRAAFVREAHRHGTKVDLVLYRREWRHLLSLPAPQLERLATQLAQNATTLLEGAPPRGLMQVGQTLRVVDADADQGDGITLFFDQAPNANDNPSQANAYAAFLRRIVLAMAAEMGRRAPRAYALNIVMPDALIGQGAYDFQTLFDLMRQIEQPAIEETRISDRGVTYRSRTNVTLRFMVLLSEPTTHLKMSLRKRIEDSPVLHGNDRRIFLRKVIPVASYGGDTHQQVSDDLAYFEDSFGGAGLWPEPVAGTGNGPLIYEELGHSYRIGQPGKLEGVCRWVCPLRWPLRAALALLLLIGAIAVSAYLGSCSVRRLGRAYLVFLLLGGVLTVPIAAALLSCDPALTAVRDGNALLWLLVAGLIGWALYANLSPRTPQP